MGELDGLDSKNVNTDKIIGVYQHSFTKYVEEEPDLLETAIKGVEDYMSVDTPKYIKGKEPQKDSLGHIIFPGIRQEILYQFEQKNMKIFSTHVRVIDRAMKVIPLVAMDIRRQLKEFKENGTPINMPVQVPKPEENPTFLERVGFKKPEDKISDADKNVQDIINHIYEIRDRWGIWKEWMYGAIKYDGDRVTWSDIYTRQGMEDFLARAYEVFNYWIVTRFLPIHQYAMDAELTKIQNHTDKFVEALARMQHESKLMNPGNQQF